MPRLIRGGALFDGTGAPARADDLLIGDDRRVLEVGAPSDDLGSSRGPGSLLLIGG